VAIRIRGCVPKPSAERRGLPYEANLVVQMDETGMNELRAFTRSGAPLHLEEAAFAGTATRTGIRSRR
jgi:hypothetical protein